VTPVNRMPLRVVYSARRGPAQACDIGPLPLLLQPGAEWTTRSHRRPRPRRRCGLGQRLDDSGPTDPGPWHDRHRLLGRAPAGARRRLPAGRPLRPARRQGDQAGRPGPGRAQAAAHARRGRGGGGAPPPACVHRRRHDRFTQIVAHRRQPGANSTAQGFSPRTVVYRPATTGPAAGLRPSPPALTPSPLPRRRLPPSASPSSSTVPGKLIGTSGELSWGGAASTTLGHQAEG